MSPQEKRRLQVLKIRQRAALKSAERAARQAEKDERRRRLQKVDMSFKYRTNPQKVRVGDLEDLEKYMKKIEQQEQEIRKQIVDKLGVPEHKLDDPDIVIGKPVARAKLENFRSAKGLREYLRIVKKQATKNMFKTKVKIYQENLVKAIKDKFVMTSSVRDLIAAIEGLTEEQVQWALITHPDVFDIHYVYHDPDTQEMKVSLIGEVVAMAAAKEFDKVEV